MPQQWGRRLALGVAFGALLYLALAVYAGWHDLRAALAVFHWPLLVPVLLLSLGNYLIRFARWQMYLRRSDVQVDAGLSLRIFFCGLVMSVTPGKLGEVLKAYLVRRHAGIPVTRTGPIVVAERVTDLLALVLLLFIGSLVFRTGWLQLALSGAITLGLVTALASPHLAQVVLHALERIGPTRAYVERIERAHASMRSLLRRVCSCRRRCVRAAAWVAECLGSRVVLHGDWAIAEPVARATILCMRSRRSTERVLLLPGGLVGWHRRHDGGAARLPTRRHQKPLAVAVGRS
jgi:hypothetical protein